VEIAAGPRIRWPFVYFQSHELLFDVAEKPGSTAVASAFQGPAFFYNRRPSVGGKRRASLHLLL
jgi:hypothetical protein